MQTTEPRLREQVETIFGGPVPEPASPESDRQLRDLAQSDPELAARPASEAAVPSVTLPSEVFVARMRRRHLLRRLLTRCFCKSAWPEGIVLDKRRILGFALVLFAGVFMPAVYLINTATIARHGGTAQVPLPSKPPVTPGSGSSTIDAFASREPRFRESQPAQGLAPVPRPVVSAAMPSTTSRSEVPPPPFYSLPRIPPPLPNAMGSTKEFAAQENPSGATPRVFAFVAPEDRPPTPQIFVFGQPETQSESSISGPIPTAPLTAAGRLSGTHEPTSERDNLRTASEARDQVSFRAGQVVTARLITGLALAPGLDPTPVFAVSDTPGWCGAASCPQVTWLGQATYAGGHRVQIRIFGALLARQSYPVQAIAMGTDLMAGVPASVSTQTPTVAAQIITAAIAASTDYLRMLGEQHQVTISSEWVTVTQSSTPDFLAHLLSRITEAIFTPNRTANVEVAEIAPMTELRILILAAQGR